jgi:cell wall assembly regulator SMI1
MTDSVANLWNRILVWLRSNAPGSLESINRPATNIQITDAQSKLGVQFPPDVIAFYRLFDGAPGIGVFPSDDSFSMMAFSPMPLAQMLEDWQIQKELVEMGDFADLNPEPIDRLTKDWWNIRWIPFADNGGGDHFCFDLAPGKNGIIGQIISHSHETGPRGVLGDSLTDFLVNLANRLETSEFEYDDDYGVVLVRNELETPQAVDSDADDPHFNEWRYQKSLRESEHAWQEKNFAAIIELLGPYEAHLDKIASARLTYARKKLM